MLRTKTQAISSDAVKSEKRVEIVVTNYDGEANLVDKISVMMNEFKKDLECDISTDLLTASALFKFLENGKVCSFKLFKE